MTTEGGATGGSGSGGGGGCVEAFGSAMWKPPPVRRAEEGGGGTPAVAVSTGGVVKCSTGAAEAAAATAAREQRDPSVLAAWYAGRARELDARGGQLRHALSLCELGVARVRVAGGVQGERGVLGGDGVEVGEAMLPAVGGEAGMVLLRLEHLVGHLSSLVRRTSSVDNFNILE